MNGDFEMDRYPEKSLFDVAKARKDDAITSHRAADKMNKTDAVRGHKARIMAVLDQATQPLNSSEIALKAGLTFMQVNRRCGELQKQGKIGSDGIRGGQRCWSVI